MKVVDYDRLTAAGPGADVYVSFDNVKVGADDGRHGRSRDRRARREAEVVMMNGGPTDNNS